MDKDQCCNHDCNQGRNCPVREGTHKPAEAVHQIQEPAPVTAMDALREAEAALEVAIARILKADPGHSISVTSEAKALVAVRAALAAPSPVLVAQPSDKELLAVLGGELDSSDEAFIRFGRAVLAKFGHSVQDVVLPEPDAAIKEVMGLVKEVRVMAIGHGIRTGGISTTSDQSIEDSANLLRELEASIETKLRALLATGGQAQAHAVEQEPFGYFKAEPFGWTDCGPDDEGAVALYERPQAQADARDAAFEAVRKEFCTLPRYSFYLDDDGDVRRVPDRTGNWVEFESVHTLFDPIAVDAAIAIAAAKGNGQ